MKARTRSQADWKQLQVQARPARNLALGLASLEYMCVLEARERVAIFVRGATCDV